MIENGARHDGTLSALALLPLHEPDLASAALVRARCHAALQKRHGRPESRAWPAWRRRFEPAIVGALCAVFLLEVLGRAVRLYPF